MSDKIIEASNILKNILETKKDELNSVDENLVNNLTIILDSKTKEQIEEYNKLLISKDNEISKLNDIIISKENEIKKLNEEIEQIKKGTSMQELEENFKKEKEQLLSKINNLEIKIYNMKEEKEKIKTEENEEKVNNIEETIDEENNKNVNNKLSYEELMKIKQDIEQKNQELNVEIKLLKDNQEPNDINNEENLKKIEELENTILEYKTGKIIPELTQKKIEENELLLNELKNQNKILNEKIKIKKDFETIIIKQENKITELNNLIKKKDNEILSKDNSLNKNQIYSIQLINIINEQKIKIEKIKKQNKEELNTQITEFKREINNLENTIELKDTMITNMKKSHKNLQDKYIKMTFNIKRKEQEDLLNQAKILKKQKNDKNALLYTKKNYSNIFNNKKNNNYGKNIEDMDNISDIKYPNLNTSPNNLLNKKNNKNNLSEKESKNSNDVILPVISLNNTEDLINNNKTERENNKLEEINEMMKKVIDDENEN
jgi:hypothetical protein